MKTEEKITLMAVGTLVYLLVSHCISGRLDCSSGRENAASYIDATYSVFTDMRVAFADASKEHARVWGEMKAIPGLVWQEAVNSGGLLVNFVRQHTTA